jgi:aconitate hydratase
MIHITNTPQVRSGQTVRPAKPGEEALRQNTMAYGILNAHNKSKDADQLQLRFDAMASHDITYVGIVQTARASGLTRFPMPYVLTNCHNSLCAVGGTINEDDHLFGLSAAQKYGGEFVPAHLAVIHQYMRECYAGCGKMILASDSHTRYGALGALSIGEGGPELVKQLLGKTYDIAPPKVVGIELTGSPHPGVGPQDAALALIAAVFPKGIVQNAVLEFVGSGIGNLSVDFRNGIDVMTTETTCLSSIWQTDEKVRAWLAAHGREEEYKPLKPAGDCYYDNFISIDLSAVPCMIALPFHPSLALPIADFQKDAAGHLRDVALRARDLWELADTPDLLSKLENGRLRTDQAFIGGCAGGIPNNIIAAADILKDGGIGSGAFSLSIYPAGVPMALSLTEPLHALSNAGAAIRSAFCGPCFGAGDVPANGGFSIRHATRNFPNREGSKPGDNQSAYVALMDARSIAATALNGGLLTAADTLPNLPPEDSGEGYVFDNRAYQSRVYRGTGNPKPETPLRFGPNIADWPPLPPLPETVTLTVAAALYDAVTTTDELIPSGETSSYRSNPMRLAEFTLSRKDPRYVERAKAARDNGGSVVVALKPGDGSAREQAASCQRVLGGAANIAKEYATKRYRSNVINWGMLPFICEELDSVRPQPGDIISVAGIRSGLINGKREFSAVLRRLGGGEEKIMLTLPGLTQSELTVILEGCLMNSYRKG